MVDACGRDREVKGNKRREKQRRTLQTSKGCGTPNFNYSNQEQSQLQARGKGPATRPRARRVFLRIVCRLFRLGFTSDLCFQGFRRDSIIRLYRIERVVASDEWLKGLKPPSGEAFCGAYFCLSGFGISTDSLSADCLRVSADARAGGVSRSCVWSDARLRRCAAELGPLSSSGDLREVLNGCVGDILRPLLVYGSCFVSLLPLVRIIKTGNGSTLLPLSQW